MIYLLDTDTFVFLLRGKTIVLPRNERQRQLRASALRIQHRCQNAKAADDVVGLSAIAIAELEFGARRSGQYETVVEGLHETLAPFARFDFDARDCTTRYGELRHALENIGTPIGANDTLIAAHALALGATLVTNNTTEFSRVPGLKCENWAA